MRQGGAEGGKADPIAARIVDFAGDLRLVEDAGGRTQLFVSIARSVEVLSKLGVRSHAKPSKR